MIEIKCPDSISFLKMAAFEALFVYIISYNYPQYRTIS